MIDRTALVIDHVDDAKRIGRHWANRLNTQLSEHEVQATSDDALLYSAEMWDPERQGSNGKPTAFSTFLYNNVRFFLLKRALKLRKHLDKNYPIDELKHKTDARVLRDLILREKVEDALAKLTTRERQVVRARFLDSEMTQAEIAHTWGISKQAVSCYETSAFVKLKEILSGRHYRAGAKKPRKSHLKAA